MASPKIYYCRLSDYTLGATYADSAYPLTNLQTYFAADQWRSNSTASPQVLLIDFGAARSCDFVVIENHNHDQIAAAVLNLEAADNEAFTSNKVIVLQDIWGSADPYFSSFTSTSRRYWRIYYEGDPTFVAPPQVGQIFLGSALTFPTTYEFPYKPFTGSFDTMMSRNLAGAKRTAQRYGGARRAEFQFRLVNDTFRGQYVTFFNTVRGRLYPFYFLDADGTSLYYVHLMSDHLPPVGEAYNVNSLQTMMLEEQQAVTVG